MSNDSQRAQFLEGRYPLAPFFAISRQDANEWYASGLRSVRVVDVISKIKRHLRVATVENLNQSVGRRLAVLHAFNGDDLVEERSHLDALECEIHLASDPTGEDRELGLFLQPPDRRNREQPLLTIHVATRSLRTPVQLDEF